MTFSVAEFEQQVAGHEMHVLIDQGVRRHVRFQKPGDCNMQFDLITWPGYLCYTGDMGTYVFRRTEDMFRFFRRGHLPDNGDRYRIDFRYWAEKLEASDRCDGVRQWSPEKFCEEVRSYFEDATEDWAEPRKGQLWQEISDSVLSLAGHSEHFAWVALHDFEYDGFRFTDWASDCKVWTFRFLWCCHALVWGIDKYDRAKQDIQTALMARNAHGVIE